MADSRLSATCEIGSTPTGRPPGEKRRSRVTSGSSRRQLFYCWRARGVTRFVRELGDVE